MKKLFSRRAVAVAMTAVMAIGMAAAAGTAMPSYVKAETSVSDEDNMPEGSALLQNVAEEVDISQIEPDDENILSQFKYSESSNYKASKSPKIKTKKGLQGASPLKDNYEDLGVQQTLFNCNILSIIGNENDYSVKYEYNGKTYYFNYIMGLGTECHSINEAGWDISVVLLLPYDSRYTNMIYSGARGDSGRTYYAWNLDDADTRELFEAILNFLADTYSVHNGEWNELFIKNWIVGNEVNMPNHWNYTGTLDLNTNVSLYARQVNLVNSIMKSKNPEMNTFISIEHSWTHNDDGRGIAGKSFIDAFASEYARIGGKEWNIAYHAYPAIMTDSNIWSSGYTTKSVNTQFISGYNIEVLTDYVKSNFGTDVRIILSEQGFTVSGGQEAKQAAALAYTYYKAEFNDMIDAVIFRSLNDNALEAQQNFRFGLLNDNGSKRASYDVFKFMDTDEWEGYTAACRATIGISDWGQVVENFDPSRFSFINPTGVTMSKSSVTIAKGYGDNLTAAVVPSNATNKSIVWSSSNDAVVTVDNGRITGVSEGTATITATCGNVSGTCEVKVVSVDEIKPQVDAFVVRIYEYVLGRTPQANETDAWAGQLLNHNDSGAGVGYGFVFSQECIGRNLSNEDFVEILYNTFLNRASDEGGKTAWASQLDAGVSRQMVFKGFALSTEFNELCASYGIEAGDFTGNADMENAEKCYRNMNANITKFVARCYTKALGRDYETEGLEAWCRVIINKENTPKEVAQNFIFSDEFIQKNLSNEEYVKVLYRTFMGREADEGGLAAWTAVLDEGREDRAKVLEGFSGSIEFADILTGFGL